MLFMFKNFNISKTTFFPIILSERYNGTWDCMVRIYRKSGIKGFYRGLWANAVRAAPQSGIEYMCYDEIRRLLS